MKLFLYKNELDQFLLIEDEEGKETILGTYTTQAKGLEAFNNRVADLKRTTVAEFDGSEVKEHAIEEVPKTGILNTITSFFTGS